MYVGGLGSIVLKVAELVVGGRCCARVGAAVVANSDGGHRLGGGCARLAVVVTVAVLGWWTASDGGCKRWFFTCRLEKEMMWKHLGCPSVSIDAASC